jgi:transcription antitermination factor NusG
MKDSWVVLEITSRGEEEARKGDLKRLLAKEGSFKPEDIYVPIIRHGIKPLWLMEGYIFIKSGYGARDYYQLKRTMLVSNIVSQIDPTTGLISKGVITDDQLKEMIKRADELGGNFQIGDEVVILEGDFLGLSGEVVDQWLKEGIRQYAVLLKFRSVEIITRKDGLSLEG